MIRRALRRLQSVPLQASHSCCAVRLLRSWLTQFGLLFKRALLAQLRNPTDVTARLFLSTWVGMLAGARTRH